MKFIPVVKPKTETVFHKDKNGNESRTIQPVILKNGRAALVETYVEHKEFKEGPVPPPEKPKAVDFQDDLAGLLEAVRVWSEASKEYEKQCALRDHKLAAAKAKRDRRANRGW